MLRQLIDLVQTAGRAEGFGPAWLYATTDHFLERFGLASADDLPKLQWAAPNMSSTTYAVLGTLLVLMLGYVLADQHQQRGRSCHLSSMLTTSP